MYLVKKKKLCTVLLLSDTSISDLPMFNLKFTVLCLNAFKRSIYFVDVSKFIFDAWENCANYFSEKLIEDILRTF